MMKIYYAELRKINGYKKVWFFRNKKSFFVTFFLIYLFY